MAADDPVINLDRVACARHLLQHPLTCAERHPDMFRLLRRHEQALDRWFTQRLGYRLHISVDTARLFKSTVVANRRPLMTATSVPRPFSRREYVLLCLILAAVAAGPRVISLRDLIVRVRTAATDAEVVLTDDPSERRALVTAVHWMVEHGLAKELHERVERYVGDASADAVLEVIPDRVALLPLTALSRAESAAELMTRSERVTATRQWMRARLVEESVLYHDDLDAAEWNELRRRLGEESNMLGEMFDLTLEVRAEGVAAVDSAGTLTDRPMPSTGTVGHAALLLLGRLALKDGRTSLAIDEVVEVLRELATENPHWSKLADEPAKLARAVLTLLADHRLLALDDDIVNLLPAAHRFSVHEPSEEEWAVAGAKADSQGQLW